ncbi:hypothetical protein K8S17_05915 [bacterium]|nr:hypothetical protein [bacterium]
MYKTVEVAIDRSNDVRRVPEVEAGAQDTVVFQAGSDTISIWFPKSGVFSTTEIVTEQTGNIEVPIPSGATPGTYSYAIYVHNVNKYAEGNSHPIMIIEEP